MEAATTAEANDNKYALIIGNEDYNKYSDGTVERTIYYSTFQVRNQANAGRIW